MKGFPEEKEVKNLVFWFTPFFFRTDFAAKALSLFYMSEQPQRDW
jgi:hypothetical protein